ncbi:spermidine/putrescine ABC transporter substrate-binding protein PotD, partial [Escherichia coli]|nr:spermidine/putrescine ABC transporter substrate-binding protein PotD [Escherichia coli]
FIMRPEIAAKIAEYQGYSSSNLAAIKFLPKSLRANPILNPQKELLLHSEAIQDIGKFRTLYQHYWELLKISS